MRIGMIISIFIITARLLLGAISFLARSFYTEELLEIVSSSYPYSVILILSIFIFISACLIGIYFWWRHHITLLYQQQQKERIINEQQAEIDEKDKQIKSLSTSNNFLSKSVHRDNKLIPAMYNALSVYLKNESDNENPAELKARGLQIFNELEEIMQERKDMIMKMQREHKALPTTGIERIDAIVNYMFAKATENNIEFDFVLAVSVKDAENTIAKQKLETLLADLIENAIIATSFSENKKVLVVMGVVDNNLEITIQDSGIPFEIETLANLGTEKSTTHADTGGSGIGYLTIFEILKERCASITITEYAPENYAFTKSVKICFDGKCGYAKIHLEQRKLSRPLKEKICT
jgi:signal transduction histidine kinase